MPSLNVLREFKTSFQNLGNETSTLMELNLPLDDLALPDKEPTSSVGEPPSAAPEPAPAAAESPPAAPEPAPPTDEIQTKTDAPLSDLPDEAASDGDFFPDLNDLLGSAGDEEQEKIDDDFSDIIPDDLTQEETTAEETPAAGNAVSKDFQDQGSQSQDSTVPGDDDFNLPPELLDGFADEIEAGDTSPGEEDASLEVPAAGEAKDEASGDDFADLDFSDQGPADTAELVPDEAPSAPDEAVTTPDEVVAASDEVTDEAAFNFELPPEESTPEESSPEEFQPEEFQPFDDTEIGNEDLSGSTTDDLGGLDESFADFDNMGISDESLEETEEFNLDDLPDFDMDQSSDEDSSAFPTDASLGETDSLLEGTGDETPFDFPMPDDLLGGETDLAGDSAPSMDLAGDEDGFEDFNAEIPGSGTEAVLEEVAGDPFDSFNLDPGALVGDMDFDVGDGFGDDFDVLEDIPIPGLDDVGEKPAAGRGKAKASGLGSDEVEEVNLSPEQLEKLLETLSSYPLNLRVACEEAIAERMVAPAQLSKLLRLLVEGAPAQETASLTGKILDQRIVIPKGYEKSSGEALEAEQASFTYIFVHNFLPVLARFMVIAGILFCLGYLCWEFIYNPIRAEEIYRLGIERIEAGEYSRANERFLEAYNIRPKKQWFFTYARAFRDARQYTLADEKYRELLYFTAARNNRNIPEKAAVLEYADMKTRFIGDFEAADSIIRRNILDYFPGDRDALLAVANNSLEWGNYEPERLEDAREAFAMLIERFGRTDPLMEGMLKYFIRTDNLGYVLNVKDFFMNTRRRISAATLAELGGYLLDKITEEVRGVPNVYLASMMDNTSLIEIREILLRAIFQDQFLPESYYHLARYYNFFENLSDEALTLEVAVRAFEAAREENTRRIGYHIRTLQRYAEILIRRREFFPAEETLIKGINLYQDALSRRLLTQAPEFGKLYTSLGDLEYFVKDGDMQNALDYYLLGEQHGWAPPEIQYRIGAAHYQLRQWGPALERLFAAHRETSPNRRILYALGNVSYMRGNYFAAQGYYDRLLEILEADRARFPAIMATNNEAELDLAERLMVAQNNLGVTLEALSERTGDNSFRSRAMGLYSDSERAWDIITRNPTTMIRMRPSPDISGPSVNPAFLNIQNSLRPVSDYQSQIFLRIDKDMLEPSTWDDLAPPGYSLSEGIYTGR